MRGVLDGWERRPGRGADLRADRATAQRSSLSRLCHVAAYRRTAAVRLCAVASTDVRVAAIVARQGGADAVVVRLAGPGALSAVPAGTARTHVVAVAVAGVGKSAAVWQLAIGRARSTRYLGLGAAPARVRHADALRAYLDLVRGGQKPSAPRPPTAPAPPASGAADLFLSTAGSDGSRCTQAAPCASFDRAYDLASPGDVVEVARGSYRGQDIDGAPKSGGSSVVFRPASGASVTVDDLDIKRGSHIEFRDLTISEDTSNLPGAQHITYRRIKMRQFFIRGADNISYVDCDVGPNVSNDGMNWITAAYQTNDGATDILLDRVRIHDFKKGTQAHTSIASASTTSDGLTIRNSRGSGTASTSRSSSARTSRVDEPRATS